MNKTTTLPPGRYYVGDLCYVVPDDQWMDFVDRCFPDGNNMVNGVFETYEGINYANFSTKYGDGVFGDYFGPTYSVDSGSIGCIPVCALPAALDIDEAKRLGDIVDFPTAFEVGYDDETGTISFGDVRIVTGDVYDDVDEDELWEDDEEEYDDDDNHGGEFTADDYAYALAQLTDDCEHEWIHQITGLSHDECDRIMRISHAAQRRTWE